MTDGYNYHLRIDLAGITFTSPGCESRGEAEALKAMVEGDDDANPDNVEVERR